MRRSGPHEENGFTLVELMIVVAIIGVLAAIAIYGVSRYLRHAKTAEATRSLAAIQRGAEVQYQRETPIASPTDDNYGHLFCPNAPAVPAAVPVGQKIPAAPGAWQTPGWTCLKFMLQDATYYQYVYTTNGATGTAARYTTTAAGDLDGNGTQSSFTIEGAGGPFGDAIRLQYTVLNEDE